MIPPMPPGIEEGQNLNRSNLTLDHLSDTYRINSDPGLPSSMLIGLPLFLYITTS